MCPLSATPQVKDVFVRQANILHLIQFLSEQLAVIKTKNHQSFKILDHIMIEKVIKKKNPKPQQDHELSC